MTTTEITLLILSCLSIIPALASLSKRDEWWIRGFDFPRLQISFLQLILLAVCLLTLSFDKAWHYLLPIFVAGNFAYQAYKIYPYTILATKQVYRSKIKQGDNVIAILVSNVLMDNDQYDRLKKLVIEEKPNILLTLETDSRWEKALEVLEDSYPHTVKVPQDNRYGMHLYSNLKLKDIEVKRIINKKIPSIHGQVQLETGKWIRFHCLHPEPPSPTEDDTSTNRDAELLLVGKDIKKSQESIVVFGDLNDVAWSRTTRLFQAISGLLDPRIGRGFFNTFHTKYPLLRWPLDHLFHTDDFTLVELKRLKKMGSDHFPIFVKLCHQPRAEKIQETPHAEPEEKEWANQKIEEGEPREQM